MVGPWFTTPWRVFPNPKGLLLGAFGLPAHPMSHFLCLILAPARSQRPMDSLPRRAVVRPRPLVPSSRVYTPPGRQQPCVAGRLDPLPSGDRFVRLARVAPFPPPSLSPVPRPRPNPLGCCAAKSHPSSHVYTPPGRQQPCGAGPLDPAARSPHRACKPREQCWAPTAAHPRPQHVGGGPRQPACRAGSRGRGSA